MSRGVPSHILFVDDDPDIRTVVELALRLDTDFEVKTCADGNEALASSAECPPALVLCDVMMPGMDGPATLARLHDNPKTSSIPVVFMTARAQPCEIARLKSLGAFAVLTKPFDPLTLAATVRELLHSANIEAAHAHFAERLRNDATVLVACRESDCSDAGPSILTECFQSCIHKLAGAAGMFNFETISAKAAALEEAIIEGRQGRRTAPAEANLDELLDCIESEVDTLRPSDRAYQSGRR
jgi:CheY-like chemotaxis protein